MKLSWVVFGNCLTHPHYRPIITICSILSVRFHYDYMLNLSVRFHYDYMLNLPVRFHYNYMLNLPVRFQEQRKKSKKFTISCLLALQVLHVHTQFEQDWLNRFLRRSCTWMTHYTGTRCLWHDRWRLRQINCNRSPQWLGQSN